MIIAPFLPAEGMAIFPFILVKKKEYRYLESLIQHEKIHLRQQIELLVLPFYVFYLLNYFLNLLKFKKHHLAYRHIVFEREAYLYENEENYLRNRTPFAWRKLIGQTLR